MSTELLVVVHIWFELHITERNGGAQEFWRVELCFLSFISCYVGVYCGYGTQFRFGIDFVFHAVFGIGFEFCACVSIVFESMCLSK
jgi:hypothetical protein